MVAFALIVTLSFFGALSAFVRIMFFVVAVVPFAATLSFVLDLVAPFSAVVVFVMVFLAPFTAILVFVVVLFTPFATDLVFATTVVRLVWWFRSLRRRGPTMELLRHQAKLTLHTVTLLVASI